MTLLTLVLHSLGQQFVTAGPNGKHDLRAVALVSLFQHVPYNDGAQLSKVLPSWCVYSAAITAWALRLRVRA
eukprot:2146688-Amphidinium_carterae.1